MLSLCLWKFPVLSCCHRRRLLSLGMLCTDGVANAVQVQLRIGAVCQLSDMIIFQNMFTGVRPLIISQRQVQEVLSGHINVMLIFIYFSTKFFPYIVKILINKS